MLAADAARWTASEGMLIPAALLGVSGQSSRGALREHLAFEWPVALISQASPPMPTSTTFDSQRSTSAAIDWRGILLGAGLSALLMFVAGMLGSLVRVPSAVLLIAAATFLGAGALTERIRPGTNPLAPGIGAAISTAVLSLIPLAFSPETRAAFTPGRLALSLLLSVLFAFALAWAGARLLAHRGENRGEKGPPSRHTTHHAPSSV